MKTYVSKDLCISCELCPSLSPALYKMDSDGKAVAIKSDNLTQQEGIEANEAADSCPSDAISVVS